MQVNLASTNPIASQSFNSASKSSPKNNEAEERQIDSEIQSLEKEKADLSKEIYSIKGDFAPPRPKEELIRPLKDKIKIIETKIQQKQAEKAEKQAENLKEPSNSTEDKKPNSIKESDIEGKRLGSAEEKNKSTFEQLSNFTTQTGIISEEKVKNSLKDSSNLLLRETSSSEYTSTINSKKINDQVKNAIDAYNLVENGESKDSTTHALA